MRRKWDHNVGQQIWPCIKVILHRTINGSKYTDWVIHARRQDVNTGITYTINVVTSNSLVSRGRKGTNGSAPNFPITFTFGLIKPDTQCYKAVIRLRFRAVRALTVYWYTNTFTAMTKPCIYRNIALYYIIFIVDI